MKAVLVQPGTHFQCGSRLTSGATAGSRDRATQPVIPSPRRMRTLPTMFSFSPLVAVSRSCSPPGSTRYSEHTSVPIAEVASRMIRSRSSSGFWVEPAAWASLTRKPSSRVARLLSRFRVEGTMELTCRSVIDTTWS